MDVVIISATPRDASQSNTELFARAFSAGMLQEGAAVSTVYLADRSQWKDAQESFLKNDKIVFILPIFSCCIPGIMAEFIESLANCGQEVPENGSRRCISFIVHGGLPMEHDFRCCAQHLKSLPALLNSNFSGIVGIGDTIGIKFIESRTEETLQKLRNLGKSYVENGGFFLPEETFWFAEVATESEMKAYCRLINRFFRHIAAARGCQGSLEERPYDDRD